MKPRPTSVINYPDLQAQKARLGLTYEDLIAATGASPKTVSAFLNGKETVNLQTIIAIAGAMKLRVKVEFEPIPAEQQKQESELRLIA